MGSVGSVGRIRSVEISSLVDWLDNPNKMSDQDFELLKHGIESEGFLQPILVWERPGGIYEMVDGHHRKSAASQVGYSEIPAEVLPQDYPEEKVQALRLALNRLRGQSNTTSVAKILQGLAQDFPGLDLSLTGYGDQEVQDLLDSLKTDDLDDILNEVGSVALDRDEDTSARSFTLELHYESADDLRAVKKALKRASGGSDLAHGLKVLVGLE